jgi:putative sporulation protein YtxC
MVLLSIGFVPEKCDIYERLNELSTYFKNKGINIGLIESDNGNMHFVKCVIADEDTKKYCLPEVKEAFNIYAASNIYEIIVDNFQTDVISKIIKENYQYFKPDEAGEIREKCRRILNGSQISSNEYYTIYLNRKNEIVNKILDYITENTDIVLEGFLRFRLKDVNSELEDVVDKVVEEYMIEKEYNEFIKLLKYFVEIQESRIEIVNIVVEDDGSYCMYDNNYNEITQELLRDMLSETLGGEVNYDDLLISSLITAAPRLIVIHNLSNVKNREIIDTIRNVFCERVKICTGCQLCESKSPVHKI